MPLVNLSEAHHQALRMLAFGRAPHDVRAAVGFTKRKWAFMMASPVAMEQLDVYKAERQAIVQESFSKVKHELETLAGQALENIKAALLSDRESVRTRASFELLDRIGLGRRPHVNINIPPGADTRPQLTHGDARTIQHEAIQERETDMEPDAQEDGRTLGTPEG